MEKQTSLSIAKSASDEKVTLTQRKWVKQVKPKDTLVRSLSDKGPSRRIKPIECLSKLKSSNQAIQDKQKGIHVIKMRKRLSFPTILPDISGSEESLKDSENSKESATNRFALRLEGENDPDDQRRKSGRC